MRPRGTRDVEQRPVITRLNGTLNIVTPALDTPPGDAIAGVNYLPHERGYQRIPGFERLDGRPKPSLASYSVLNFDAGSAAITEGQTVTGLTSSATGKALFDAVVTSGSYGGGDAAGYLVLTTVSGDFQDNESLQVSAVTKSTSNGLAVSRGALTDANDTTWIQDAIETARALIQKPTGSGSILGTHVFNGDKYCVRVDGGVGKLYKATTSGWAVQSLGSYIKFDAGTAAFTAGETLTGATSTHTATIVRVVVRSGTPGSSNQTGLLIVSGATGTFNNNETITSAAGSATSDGTVTANALPATGRYEFVNNNFFGASNLRRMYGCNGVGTAFEWDGTVFVPIFTGMTVDTPNHIAAHKGQLFLSFPGGSVQHSGIGDPYAWSAVLGAAEIGMGDDVTGFIQDYAGVLIIFARNSIKALYGSSPSDWNLVSIADDAGAVEWTAQRMGNPLYMDDRGLRSLNTTSAFGDFNKGTISKLIAPLFQLKRSANVYAVGSVRLRSRDEYRVFFSDGTGIAVYLGGKSPRLMPFDLDFAITSICSGEESNGDEIILFGNEEGWVFQMEAGTSFDGEAVPAFIRLAFNHCGSPAQNKRFHKAGIEGDFAASNEIALVAEFDYGDSDRPPTSEQSFSIRGSGGFWDEMFWDSFYWDNAVEGRAEARINGHGRNCSITVISESIYEAPHILHGLTLYYTPRNLVR